MTAAPSTPIAPSPHALASVVIIDDTPDLRMLLRVVLRRHGGFTVVGEAGDGRAGLALVTQLCPDLVVLDLAMPVMDGLRALPLIRLASPRTVVVVLSGFEESHMREAALAAGAAAYVQKGASPTAIVDALVAALRVGDDVPEVPEAAEASPPVAVRPARAAAPATRPRPAGDHDGEAGWALLVRHAVGHALIGLTDTGDIELWNHGAQQLTGRTRDEVLGRHFSILYPTQDRRSGITERLLDDAQETGRATHHRWLVTASGERFWAEVELLAVPGEDGWPHGYALVVHDRTDRRRVDQAQASLLATVSHDLRTPITAIRAFASLLPGVDADERAEFAERIDANALHLDHLVRGLFDYAKVRAGAVTIMLEPVPLAAFARECVARMGAVLADATVVVADSVAESSVIGLVDTAALARVLDNLLTNAVKYSPPGSTITISCRALDGSVELAVRDTGRGIDPDDLATICDEFVRGRMAADDGGTGLGLASVKRLMLLQNGDVGITSEVGVGTTVTLRFARG